MLHIQSRAVTFYTALETLHFFVKFQHPKTRFKCCVKCDSATLNVQHEDIFELRGVLEMPQKVCEGDIFQVMVFAP